MHLNPLHNGDYYALHVRRGDFQYPSVKITAEKIVENLHYHNGNFKMIVVISSSASSNYHSLSFSLSIFIIMKYLIIVIIFMNILQVLRSYRPGLSSISLQMTPRVSAKVCHLPSFTTCARNVNCVMN